MNNKKKRFEITYRDSINMKNRIKSIIQIITNIICATLYFCKIFIGVGLVLDGEGTIIEKYFYHSPLENLYSMSLSPLIYISFALIIASVILSVISLIKREKKTTKASFILSLISVLFATALIIVSSTVGRGY